MGGVSDFCFDGDSNCFCFCLGLDFLIDRDCIQGYMVVLILPWCVHGLIFWNLMVKIKPETDESKMSSYRESPPLIKMISGGFEPPPTKTAA